MERLRWKKMTREFDCIEDIEEYYDEKSNTYIFMDDGRYIDLIIFNFNLKIDSNIDAYGIIAKNISAHNIIASDIKADNINAYDIHADNIEAYNIKARNISYYAVCFTYYNLKYKSIEGRRGTTEHCSLDCELEVKEDEK